MKRVALLLLFVVLLFAFSSCRGEADVVIDPGHEPAYSTYDSIPADRDVLVMNTESMKIHRSSCRYAASMKEDRRLITDVSFLDYFTDRGYEKCRVCFPEKGGN